MGFWLIPILHGDFLPAEKPEELLADLQSWPYSKRCLKRVLLLSLFLTCKLNFACCIISAGCIFLCHLIDISMTARMPHCHITMNVEVCWWVKLLSTWNVCTIIPDADRSRSPCTPGTLHRCIWYPWLWYLLYWPLDCRQPSSYPTGLLHMWSLVACVSSLSSTVVDFIFGPLAHSVTPLSYTSSLQFFLALHLATVNSLSPALPVLNTLLLAPYPDGKVLTTSSNCRPSMDTNSCISSDPLEYPLAFLQSQAIATYTCHTYLADICRYTTFCISKQKQSFQGFRVWHQTQHRNSLSTLSSHHHGTPLPNQGQVSSSPWHPPSGKTNVVVCLYTGVLWFSPLQGGYFLIHNPVQPLSMLTSHHHFIPLPNQGQVSWSPWHPPSGKINVVVCLYTGVLWFSPLQGDYFLIHNPVQPAGAPWLIRHFLFFQRLHNSTIEVLQDRYLLSRPFTSTCLSIHASIQHYTPCVSSSLSLYVQAKAAEAGFTPWLIQTLGR